MGEAPRSQCLWPRWGLGPSTGRPPGGSAGPADLTGVVGSLSAAHPPGRPAGRPPRALRAPATLSTAPGEHPQDPGSLRSRERPHRAGQAPTPAHPLDPQRRGPRLRPDSARVLGPSHPRSLREGSRPSEEGPAFPSLSTRASLLPAAALPLSMCGVLSTRQPWLSRAHHRGPGRPAWASGRWLSGGLMGRPCPGVGTALGGGKPCRGRRALPSGLEGRPGAGMGLLAWGPLEPWGCAYCPPDRALCWPYSDFLVSPTECRRLKAPAKIKFTPRATLGTCQPVHLNFPSSTGELEFP